LISTSFKVTLLITSMTSTHVVVCFVK